VLENLCNQCIAEMLLVIFLISGLIFFLAYSIYPKFLSKKYNLDDRNPTPAHTLSDGIDYLPTHRLVLLGHHFSSIAGAGPVVGPIIAGLAFGWGPAVLWVILGCIFIGGVHDFSALVASIRHNARSIAEIAKVYVSPRAYRLLLSFTWFALIYVLIVFLDLTANTFKIDGGVATSSIIYIFLALGFGISLYRLRLPLKYATIFFVSLVFLSIWLGQKIPLTNIPVLFGDKSKTWAIFLLIYCFLASVLPVWILLQPRDYLCSYLLYASVAGGFLGIVFGSLISTGTARFSLNYPLFLAWNAENVGTLFPLLFVTVACGAISGFHSLVASGTTSKQLNKEKDARLIGYGAMLIEGLVAIIALVTVMVLTRDEELTKKAPLVVYATGMGKFLNVFGLPREFGFSFGLLALATFILTTLDTATRIARYIFQEFFNLRVKETRYFATAMTLILPTIFVLITLKDKQGNPLPAWKVIWPVFGATNQLLAGLTLLVIAVWLKKKGGKNIFFILLPMIFMLGITLWALGQLIFQYKFSLPGVLAVILFLLALVFVAEGVKILK